MTDITLPPLPRPSSRMLIPGQKGGLPQFSLEKMREYATAAVLAERERWRLLLSQDHIFLGDCPDVEHPDRRDAECPVCVRMGELT